MPYRDANQRREYYKQWLAANQERVRERAKQWREENKESIKAKKRAYHQATKERTRARRNAYQRRCCAEQRPWVIQRKQRQKARVAQNRNLLDQVLWQVPCVDCGEADFRCLEFHHREGAAKQGEMGRLVSCGRKTLLDELNKCDVLCANCHLRKHAINGKVLYSVKPKIRRKIHAPDRSKPTTDPKKKEYNRQYRARNREHLREHHRQYQKERHQQRLALLNQLKVERGCRECGLNELVCLEWHHRDPQTEKGNLAKFCGYSSRERLREEIAKCEVLCANCHAKHHHQERRLPPGQRKKQRHAG